MEQQKQDYRHTVLTPQTEFPMRAKLATREPERLRRWEEMGLYHRLQELRRDCPDFILHDGPPYANGTAGPSRERKRPVGTPRGCARN